MDQKQKAKEKSRKWREANPDKYKEYFSRYGSTRHAYKLKSKYGMSPEDYQNLLELQGFRCAICFAHQKEFHKRFAVDHCHETNVIRGLLCSNCNRAIGLLRDNKSHVLRAYRYLAAHSK